MFNSTKRYFLFLCVFTVAITSFIQQAFAQDITLYTPYTKISVPPGESIEYNVDIINNSSSLRNIEIAVVDIPKDWTYTLKSGGWNVGQISILPKEKKSLSLKINVPYKVNKGTYRLKVVGIGCCSLPLTIVISEQGTYKTEFTAEQINLQGHSASTFTYNANLKNQTAEKQLYALNAFVPRGWIVTFKAKYKQVTSVELEANSSEKITIEIDPPDNIEAGTYEIPIQAVTSSTSAELKLQAVITGSYKVELTTPTGLLSTSTPVGGKKRIILLVKNVGSSELTNINLTFSAPSNWDVIFDPTRIEKLEPGNEAQVFATIKSDKKSIPGDYGITMEAKTAETSSKISFRVAVKTPLLWGWLGILIIIAALAGVYYLFRKYGRR
jgi:uncharacterized membrane protein